MSKKRNEEHLDSLLSTNNNPIPSGVTAYIDYIKSGINQIGLHIILDEGVKFPEAWNVLINNLLSKDYTPIVENPKLFDLFKLLTENASVINEGRSTHASYYLRSEAVRIEFRGRQYASKTEIEPDIDEANTEKNMKQILSELDKFDDERKKEIFYIFWHKIKAQIKNDQASDDILMYLARNLQLDEEPLRLLNKLHKKPAQVVVKAVEFDQRFMPPHGMPDHEKAQLNDKETDIVNFMAKLVNIKKLSVTVVHEQHNHLASDHHIQPPTDEKMDRLLGKLSTLVTPLLASVFTVILVKNERYFFDFLSGNDNPTDNTRDTGNEMSTLKSLKDANKYDAMPSEFEKRTSPSLTPKDEKPENTILYVDLDEAFTAFDISFILYFTNKIMLEKLEERKNGYASVSWIKGFNLIEEEENDNLVEIHYFLSSKYNYVELTHINNVRSISECYTCVKLFRNDQKFSGSQKKCSLKSAKLLERIPSLLPGTDFKSSEKLVFNSRCVGNKYNFTGSYFYEDCREFSSYISEWQLLTFRFVSFNFPHVYDSTFIMKFIELIKKLETKLLEPDKIIFNSLYPPIVTRICIYLSNKFDLVKKLKVTYPDILLESESDGSLNNIVIIDVPQLDITKLFFYESLLFDLNGENYCFLLQNKETHHGNVTFNNIDVSYKLAPKNQPINQGECHFF